ncbi:hypothetical protein KL905_004450 [Ogataea polymorpha]|uniref:Fe2OG dioxygenase domain-containing protein n=1 Tax=Ogataea polymorpha TaxID=460523 RepID=A0A9P8PUD3_9ASCO|nr:hypothetical protein KL935_004682 [Ogataea polymorpha]KAG7900444.1 hypothetical protein KL907_004562 [Ogataea polymorpha]KAG7917430.1 hypothetical protein KL905_004450 [Ogataea polymorpha]KAG7924905.1 hypothetical protein KL925_004747 [Ogataea polymorpha]KAG7930678.1 hypothetical protein KL934_004751 [Ogataea polymorpha]
MTTVENPLEIVDISEINQQTAEKLLHAASTQGFLMVEGHGLSQEQVDQLFGLSRDFFQLPFEEKQKYKIDESNHGYTGIGVENLEEDDLGKPLGDPKEAFNFARVDMSKGELTTDEIPAIFEDPENKKIIQATLIKLRESLFSMLRLMAMGLKIDETEGGVDWFTSRHDPTKPSGTTFRFLHYPSPVKEGMTEKDLDSCGDINVAGAHTDYGCVTLLLQRQDEDGLEILSPVSRKWEAVPFVPASPKYQKLGQAPPLVVNIADQLCYWTNGLLKSTVHRVRFPRKLLLEGKPRYSIVLFVHPADDTLLEPVPSEKVSSISGRGAAHYLAKHGVSLTAGEHLAKRLATTYGWKTEKAN